MAKAKKKSKRKHKLIDQDWDPWYCKMLDAVAEYMESMSEKSTPESEERDHRIIRALIEFYGFSFEDVADILDDVNARVEYLEQQKKLSENH